MNLTALPKAPLQGKTPPAGGGGTFVPEGERLSSESETERLDKCDLISTAALYNLSVNAGALPPLLVGEALAMRKTTRVK